MSVRNLIRLIPAGLLGVGAAVLVSCGSSGKGLIPLAYAGPLQSDFQAVLQTAQEGDGSCAATNAKIAKTEHDLRALPATVDGGLRGRLAEGVANLAVRARTMCAQPLSPLTTTTSTTSTSPPQTSTTPSTTTSTAPTATTPTTGTPPTATSPPSDEGGATRAPGTGNDEGHGSGEAEPESEQEAAGGVEAGEIGANGGTGGGR
jgi:hypothetical protein